MLSFPMYVFVEINEFYSFIMAFDLIFSKKDLKLELLFDLNFLQPSFSNVSTTLKKKSKQIFDITAESCYHSEYFLVRVSTSEITIFYSWKLLSFWIFSGQRKYIWKYHLLQMKAVIILNIFLSKQVIWKHYFLQLVVVE